MHYLMHMFPLTTRAMSSGNDGFSETCTRLILRVCEIVSLVDKHSLCAVTLGYFHWFWPPSEFSYVGLPP